MCCLFLGFEPVYCDRTLEIDEHFTIINLRQSSRFSLYTQSCYCALYPRSDTPPSAVTSSPDAAEVTAQPFSVVVYRYDVSRGSNSTWLRLSDSLWPERVFTGLWFSYDVTADVPLLSVLLSRDGARASRNVEDDVIYTMSLSEFFFITCIIIV